MKSMLVRYPFFAIVVTLSLIVAVLGLASTPPVRAAEAQSVLVCLDGNAQGWCRVQAPVVRHKSAILSQTSSALAAGGRTTRYVAFASIDYQARQFIVAFEDVSGFQTFRYDFGQTDPSACTFVAHDDGGSIGLKGFCANYQGDGQPRSLDVWDSGWRYFGP